MRLSAEVSRLTVAAAAPAARRGVFEQELVLLILRRTGGCSENEEGRGEDVREGTSSYLRRNVTPYPDTGQESTSPNPFIVQV